MQMNYLQEQILVLHQCQSGIVTHRLWARQCVPVSACLKVYKLQKRKLRTEPHWKLHFLLPDPVLSSASKGCTWCTYLLSVPAQGLDSLQLHSFLHLQRNSQGTQTSRVIWNLQFCKIGKDSPKINGIPNGLRAESRLWTINIFSWYHPKAMRTGLFVIALRSLLHRWGQASPAFQCSDPVLPRGCRGRQLQCCPHTAEVTWATPALYPVSKGGTWSHRLMP